MSNVHVIILPTCTTCKRALKWLDAHNINYTTQNVREQPPTREALSRILTTSGLPFKKLFNTSGKAYKEQHVSQQIKDGMTEDAALDLLASDGMLVKRPILEGDKGVLIGFKEDEWEAYFSA